MTAFRTARKAHAAQTCLPGMEDMHADQAQFRATRYETIAPLLSVLRLPGGHWVEPCAGDGDIIEHVANAHRDGLCPLPSFWTAVELRASHALADIAEQERGDPCLTRSGHIWAYTETDFLTFGDVVDPGVSVVLTNWPWPGHVERLAAHVFTLYPNAEVVGLLCVREWLDGSVGPGGHDGAPDDFACEWCAARGLERHDTRDRREWFRRHHPDLYWCNGRQPFEGHEAGYPHPLAWCHWPANARNRDHGRWQMLPRWSGV